MKIRPSGLLLMSGNMDIVSKSEDLIDFAITSPEDGRQSVSLTCELSSYLLTQGIEMMTALRRESTIKGSLG